MTVPGNCPIGGGVLSSMNCVSHADHRSASGTDIEPLANTRLSRLLSVNFACAAKPASSPSAVDFPALFGPTNTTTPFGSGSTNVPFANCSHSKYVIGLSLATTSYCRRVPPRVRRVWSVRLGLHRAAFNRCRSCQSDLVSRTCGESAEHSSSRAQNVRDFSRTSAHSRRSALP